MLFTVFVAVLAATLWALRSFYLDAGGGTVPHDPSTLELAIMAAVTMAAYGLMRRLRAIRQQATTDVTKFAPPSSVPARYAEAKVEAAAEESREEAGQVA